MRKKRVIWLCLTGLVCLLLFDGYFDRCNDTKELNENQYTKAKEEGLNKVDEEKEVNSETTDCMRVEVAERVRVGTANRVREDTSDPLIVETVYNEESKYLGMWYDYECADSQIDLYAQKAIDIVYMSDEVVMFNLISIVNGATLCLEGIEGQFIEGTKKAKFDFIYKNTGDLVTGIISFGENILYTVIQTDIISWENEESNAIFNLSWGSGDGKNMFVKQQ